MTVYVGEAVRAFAKVSRSLYSRERTTVAKVCEASKAFFLDKARAEVAAANGGLVLQSYSSDGTPLQAKKRLQHQLLGGKKVVRVGGSTQEYLVQQGFLRRFDVDGVAHTAAVLRDPMPLTEGKGAWPIFAAGCEFAPTLREMGHMGIAVQHYLFDRGLGATLQRSFKQRHKLLATQRGTMTAPNGSVVSPELAELLEWTVGSGCGAHDTRNALKWALFCSSKIPRCCRMSTSFWSLSGTPMTSCTRRWRLGWATLSLSSRSPRTPR